MIEFRNLRAAMANIAAVFHWPPSEMQNMPVTELMEWHKLAMERAGAP